MSVTGRQRKASFVERVLDGETRIEAFPSAVREWQEGKQKQPLHTALGLDADELMLVASSPDALRYVLYSRRFGGKVNTAALNTQARVSSHAMQLASEAMDPYVLADVEQWLYERTQAQLSGASSHA